MKLIHLCGLAAVGLGGALLTWYHHLSPDEQAEADRTAGECARALFSRRVPSLDVRPPQGRGGVDAARHLFARVLGGES